MVFFYIMNIKISLLKYIDSYGIKKNVIPETCSEFGHFPEANQKFLPTDFSWELPIWISQSCDTKTKGTGPVWPNPMETLGSEGYPAW